MAPASAAPQGRLQENDGFCRSATQPTASGRYSRLSPLSRLAVPARAARPAGRSARRDRRRTAVFTDDALRQADVGADDLGGAIRLGLGPARLSLQRAAPGRQRLAADPGKRADHLACGGRGRPVAGMLSDKLLQRGRPNGPASGPRRGRLRLAGGLGQPGGRWAVSNRQSRPGRQHPKPLAALGRCDGDGRRG